MDEITKHPTRFVLSLVILCVISGALGGAVPSFLIETYDHRSSGMAPVVISYLWPGFMFGIAFVGAFRRAALFMGLRGWLMVLGSKASFVLTLMASGFVADELRLSDLLAFPVGGFVGMLLFMLVAAKLERFFRAPEVIISAALIGGLLLFPMNRSFDSLGDSSFVLVIITAFWQGTMAFTLGLLTVWRARRLTKVD